MPTPKANPETAVRPGVDRPTYAAAFRCIGPACEDPCCSEWDIPLDQATYAKYQLFRPEQLGSVVSQFVSITTAGQSPNHYTDIHRTPSGLCPFWDTDRLCSIQKHYGPQLLSATCSIYPRSLSRVDGELEGTLSLSCPEAARNVLLAPDFMQIGGDLLSGAFRTDNSYRLASGGSGPLRKPRGSFHALRSLLVETVTDRSRPLGLRLLLIGSLCRHLQEVVTAGGDETIPQVLSDYRRMLQTQEAHPELEGMPSDPALKLDVVLKLTDSRVREKTCGKRFRDTFWTFIEGIASPDNSTPGSDIGCFLYAERTYHRPFFEKHPFILENYLLNYILQNLFPIGREGTAEFAPRSMFDEFILMATQFAWINTLLIGVAGRHKKAFAADHVIQVVQSFTREVEHYPPVLNWILESVKDRKMDSLQGMSILLRL